MHGIRTTTKGFIAPIAPPNPLGAKYEDVIKTQYNMNKNNSVLRLTRQIFICLLLLPSSSLLFAQTTDYNSWDHWDDICYCTMNNSYHPSSIVSADNNLQLLLALKNGLRRKQLDSLKIPYTKSQLLLLESYHLIEKTDGIYKTAIPILDIHQTARLREQSLLTANQIYPEIEKECRDLVAHLTNQNRARNAYSILFSYVLDGLIWDSFEKEGIVKAWDTTAIWSGNYWFLTPKRAIDCGGTNYSTNGNFAFKWNWSYAEKVTGGLWDKNIEALFPFAQGNICANKEIVDEFAQYGFFDKDSRLTIPVINEKENNSLYLLSKSITNRLLSAFIARANVEQLKTAYNFNDNSETVVVFYHEVMFDLMDLLTKKQVIQLPTAFQNPDKATLTDAADLCFIVISE